MKHYYLIALLATLSFSPPTYSSNDGWNDQTKAQYHIQTDEGPERYFRYQTLSGQYRKEKRLEDGTVIGTYGWVDDDGILRMRDYIADNSGYRVLKIKNVFVGRNRPINQALSIAKKAPAQSDDHIKPTPKPSSTPYYSSPPATYTPAVTQTKYVRPAGYSVEHLQTPIFKYATYTVPQPTSSLDYNAPSQPIPPYLGYTPSVEVSLNSIPSSTEIPIALPTAVPSSTILPPDSFSSTPTPPVISTTPPTVYIPSTTPSSIANYSSTPSYTLPSTNYGSPVVQYVSSTTPAPYVSAGTISTIPPPINSNALDSSLYSGDPQYEHYPENERDFINPYIYQNGPTYPIDRRGNTYNGQSNNIGNGYNSQFQFYDGISVTNDGFRYYIPKQYHEEQNLPDNQKSGSFGYVDPFGIRRVVYYNAGPDGFKHRKNNRYVGLDATPYDPRPY